MRRLTAIVLAMISLQASAAPTELQSYVQQCQAELEFNASDVPALDCNDGELFAGSGDSPINDWVVHRRVNDNVDLVAACRWGNGNRLPSNTAFISLELIIHNRQNGATCFFGAKEGATGDPTKPIPNPMVSPTNFSNVHPNADDYWLRPTDLNNKTLPSDANSSATPITIDSMRCVGCHSQGPYIASKDIAPYLAQFGLLNDGHDIAVDMAATKHYRVVGSSAYNNPTDPLNPSAFRAWNSIIANNLNSGGCASGCHRVASNSTIGSLFPDPNVSVTKVRILPSIHVDIKNLGNAGMPPYNDDSVYRWMNLDTPGDGMDSESFADAKTRTSQATATMLFDCGAPDVLEAHAVGVPIDYSLRTGQMAASPDRLRAFNLKEGLVCLNADQDPNNQCHDYATSYLCDGKWTDESLGWFNTDTPTSTGDHEERSRNSGLCAAPTAIKARLFIGDIYKDIYGPNDKLARLSPYGLTCNNADQPDGKCSNYVVRYSGCRAAPVATTKRLSSVYSSKQLTATGSGNNAEVRGQPANSGWNTQRWVIEPVTNTEYVRLKNVGTSLYLNASSQVESAAVLTYTLNQDWWSQMWIVEPVYNSSDVRLKNLWSARYLTIADNSNFAGIFLQSLNPSWTSQRWVVQ